MHTVEALIDAYESQIVEKGVSGVALSEFVHDRLALEDELNLSSQTAVELLRVWLEHSRSTGAPISVKLACEQLPATRFSSDELRILQFEVDRLNAIDAGTESTSAFGDHEFPRIGDRWQDFQLVELLGQGAFARVFLARQLTMANRHVVLKLTRRKTPESQMLARLHHSSIVPIFSEHTDGQIQGVCMPYLGNTTVADLLGEIETTTTQPIEKSDKSVGGSQLLRILCERQQHITTVVNRAADLDTKNAVGKPDGGHTQKQPTTPETLSPQTESLREATAQELSKLDYADAVAWIGSQIANALAHAHRHGILHCDVKPANILIGADGQARLLDFNVSVDEFSRTQDKEAIRGGTLPYMSPEQLASFHSDQTVPLDERSDIYSLGIVLLEMLTGRVPTQQASEQPIDVRQLLSDAGSSASRALEAIINRCVQNSPDERYQSAEQLYADLDAHCHQLPLVHQPEPSLFEKWAKWRRRHPVITSTASVASIAFVAIAASIAGMVWRGVENDRIERDQRTQQVAYELPRAVAAISSVRGHPDLRKEAHERTVDILQLLSQGIGGDHDGQHKLQPKLNNFLRLVKRESTHGAFADQALSSEIEQLLKEIEPMGLAKLDDAATSNYAEQLWDAYDQRAPGRVVGLAKELPELHAHDYGTHLLLGISHLELRQYESAQEAFSRCLGLRPEIEYAWFYRGIARHKAKRYEEAAEDFKEALAINGNFASARYNRALALEALGAYRNAIAELDLAIKSGWQSVLAYSVRARLHQRLGQPSEAQSDIHKAVEVQPRTILEWVQRGVIKMGYDPSAAEQDLLQALSIDPNHLDTRQNLSHLYAEKLGKPEKAMEQLDELVRLDAKNPLRWSGRGVVLARAGKVDAAIEDLSKAAGLQVENPLVAYQIASGFALVAAAIQSKKNQAESVDPNDRAVSDNNRFEETFQAAIRWYSFAVRKNPKIRSVADADDDISWLREQDEFKKVNDALATVIGLPKTSTNPVIRHAESK